MRQPIRPGEVYEDCAYHPVLCTEVTAVTFDAKHWWAPVTSWIAWKLNGRAHDFDVAGVSLADGSRPRLCSWHHCGCTRLATYDDVQQLLARQAWAARRETSMPDRR